MKISRLARILIAITFGFAAVGAWAVITVSAHELPGNAGSSAKVPFQQLQSALSQLQEQMENGTNSSKAVPHLGQNTTLKFKDEVKAIISDTWTIGLVDVNVVSTTVIIGKPVVGSMVNVWIAEQEDGTNLALKIVETNRGESLEGTPTPTATITTTVTATITATQEMTETEEITETEEGGPAVNPGAGRGKPTETPTPPVVSPVDPTMPVTPPGLVNKPSDPGKKKGRP